MLNRVRAGTVLAGKAAESLKGTSAAVLPVALCERTSFQHAATRGWAALDPKAESEALLLTAAVTSLRLPKWQRGKSAGWQYNNLLVIHEEKG